MKENKQWWKRAVVYQIYPKSFCDSNGDGIGDLRGVMSKLDYLKNLGIDVVWLSPIYESPDMDNGYDVSNYEKIQAAYGTMEDFDELLRLTHEKGMRLIMDLVVNHSSDQHEWYKKAIKDKNCPEHNYYYFRKGKDGKEPNNWQAMFGGSAWTYIPELDEYSLGIFSPYQPDLNWSNKELREKIYEMVRFWLDKGVDGFRLDAIQFIGKDTRLPNSKDGFALANDPCVHDYLFEMYDKVFSKYDIMTVGEAADSSLEDMLKYAGEGSHELNMLIRFHHVLLDMSEEDRWETKPVKLSDMKKLFATWQTSMYKKAWDSLYWNNHDQPRVVSRFGNDSKEYREPSAKMLATCVQLMMGTPFIYEGEEIGMTNVVWNDISELRDIEEINAYNEALKKSQNDADDILTKINISGRDNARTPMQWTADKNGGFTVGTPWIKVNENHTTINVEEQKVREDSVLSFYKKLIMLRKTNETIISGSYEPLDLDNEKIFAYMRKYEDSTVLVVCNFTSETVNYPYESYLENKSPNVLLCNYDNSTYVVSNTLLPYESIVLEVK